MADVINNPSFRKAVEEKMMHSLRNIILSCNIIGNPVLSLNALIHFHNQLVSYVNDGENDTAFILICVLYDTIDGQIPEHLISVDNKSPEALMLVEECISSMSAVIHCFSEAFSLDIHLPAYVPCNPIC